MAFTRIDLRAQGALTSEVGAIFVLNRTIRCTSTSSSMNFAETTGHLAGFCRMGQHWDYSEPVHSTVRAFLFFLVAFGCQTDGALLPCRVMEFFHRAF